MVNWTDTDGDRRNEVKRLKTCVVCGKEFEAKRSHAKYCSSTCRGRAKKQREDRANQFRAFHAFAEQIAGENLDMYERYKVSMAVRELMRTKVGREAFYKAVGELGGVVAFLEDGKVIDNRGEGNREVRVTVK